MSDRPSSPRSRILLFTGKGGVGKTTIAAATAIRAAELGHKTLVMSADPAHSLGDALDHPLGPEPVEILPNLHAQELDLYYSMKKYWGNLREMILQVFKWQNVDEVLAEEVAALPGMAEGSAFMWVEKFYDEGEYDLIIIDAAPTAETMTLLNLPQVSQWWMERAFPFQKVAARAFGPMIRLMTSIPVDRGYEEMDMLYKKLLRIHNVLSDPEVSSMRIVLNPERMVIREAQRAYTYLQLYGYPVDAVIVNRIMPEEAPSPAFAEYFKTQETYLSEIERGFSPVPVLKAPHLGKEIFGTPLLREIGRTIYGTRDPRDIFFKGSPFQLTAQKGAYLLRIHLPFASEEGVAVAKHGDGLAVQVNNQRRNVFLPKFLSYYESTESHFEDGWLSVQFEKPR